MGREEEAEPFVGDCDECGGQAITTVSMWIFGRRFEKSLCVEHLGGLMRCARPQGLARVIPPAESRDPSGTTSSRS